MDALWESDPRRLSEAGLRRMSDHSIILTEDTDGFIIGDRVYVGGSKPGQIAYIGETQFAPGEWAGVVLDEPIGKNDGSVGGVRYFQCEVKKGVFSRLTRLTRNPLSLTSPMSPGSDKSSIISEKPPIVNGSTRKLSSPASVSSIPRARRSLSPSGSIKSTTSKISTSTSLELRLGDRVIVSSSHGSKAGTLRYMGTTEFAQGQWCGVELDDPIGKNDGSVEGKRYFDCPPRFGLFAPLSKISRSPSNRRPGTCAVHGRGSPPDSLTSSMISATGSIRPRLGVTSLGIGNQRLTGPRAISTPMSAKNTLQELLREKQQHIERLMIELESEKIEIAKVFNKIQILTDELNVAKNENAKYVEEISKLNSEKEYILRQLDDEKQKVDDLLFRAEEDNIHKEDFNEIKNQQNIKINNLEEEILKIKNYAEELQMQNELLSSQHKAEIDIIISQHKDELKASQDLASQLQSLLDEAYTLLKEKESENESINKNHFEEMSKLKMESEKSIHDLKTKLFETEAELSTFKLSSNDKLSEAEHKLAVYNEKIEKITLDNENIIRDLKIQLEQNQNLLNQKNQDCSQIQVSFREQETNYKTEIEKLKMNYSSLNIDYENIIDLNKKLESKNQNLHAEFTLINNNLNEKVKECEINNANNFKEQDSLKLIIDDLKEKLNTQVLNMNHSIEEYSNVKLDLQKQIEEHINLIKNKDETEKQLNLKITEFEKKIVDERGRNENEFEKLKNEHNTEIKNLNETLNEEKHKLELEFEENKKALLCEINKHLNEIQTLTSTINEYKNKIDEISEKYNENNKNLSSFELSNAEIKRHLQMQIEKNEELLEQKNKLEKEISDLTHNSSNSNEQLSILSDKLRNAENEISTLKDDIRKNKDEFQKKEDMFNHEVKTNSESLKMYENQNKALEEKIKIMDNDFNELKQTHNENLSIINSLESNYKKEQTILAEKDILIGKKEEEMEKVLNKKTLLENDKKVIMEEKEELQKNYNNLSEKLNIKENMLNDQELIINEIKAKIVTLDEALYSEHYENNFNLSSVCKYLDEVMIFKEKYLKLENQLESTIKSHIEESNSLKSANEKLQNNIDELKLSLLNVNEMTTKMESFKKCSENYENEIQDLKICKENDEKKYNDTFKKISDEFESFKLNITTENNNLQFKIEEYELEICNKNGIIERKDKKQKEMQLKTEEMEITIKSLQNNINNMKVLFSKQQEEENCKNHNDLLKLKDMHEQEITRIKEEYSKLSEKQIHDINLIKETDKKQNIEEYKKLFDEFEILKKNSSIECDNLKKELEIYKMEILNKNKEITLEQDKIKVYEIKLEESESFTQNLQKKIDAIKINIEKVENEKLSITEMQSSKLNEIESTFNKEICEMTGKLENLQEQFKIKVIECDYNKNQLSIMNENVKKTDLESEKLKQEIIVLNKKLTEYENNNHIKSNIVPIIKAQEKSTVDTERLLEEKREVEGQVNFLNSVIVDMQKKNEELKARVEILEMGVLPNEVEEFNFVKKIEKPPRMFCDICDIFDAHETEDCPRQTNDDIDVHVKSSEKKKPSAPRPYCNICEVFGHETEDCDDEETF